MFSLWPASVSTPAPPFQSKFELKPHFPPSLSIKKEEKEKVKGKEVQLRIIKTCFSLSFSLSVSRAFVQ